MEQERRAIRWGLVLILVAAVWRIGVGGKAVAFLQSPDAAAMLISIGTGRMVHLTVQAAPREPGPETETPQEAAAVQFAPEDGAYLAIYDLCSYDVDMTELLLQPLELDLKGTNPSVLILHTHATESYALRAGGYEENNYYRSQDINANMVKVGQLVTQRLREQGIGVVHDQTLHDRPSYEGSYDSSRQSAQDYMAQNPSIQVVLDLHRDAAENPDGSQMDTAATVDGQSSAQIMFVVGTDAAGLSHPNWRQNMALAVKLQALLEKRWPGLCRPICFRAERFNQDLLDGALLVEVGAAGNTMEEALVAAECLSWALGQLADGANTS